MTQSKLNDLLDKASKEVITLSEVAEICGAAFQSNSKHAKDIKDLLTKLNNRLDVLENKINYLYENNSPVFAAVIEDEKED